MDSPCASARRRPGATAAGAAAAALAASVRRRRSTVATRSSAAPDDGTIVRDPAEATAGTPLAVALSRGALAATSDGPAAAPAERRRVSDLVVFVGIVGIVVVLGIVVGMIVAGRIDRILAPVRPSPRRRTSPQPWTSPHTPAQEEHP